MCHLLGQSRSDLDDQLPSDMTYRKPVYLKSFPSTANYNIYFSVLLFLKNDLFNAHSVFFFFFVLFYFIIISEASVGTCYTMDAFVALKRTVQLLLELKVPAVP